MNCGCPECGTLTVQAERGLDSRCVCPACGWTCRECLGARDGTAALDREQVRAMKDDAESSMDP